MRTHLKRGVERAMTGSGMASLVRRWRPGRSLILAYHNVVPDDWRAVRPDSAHMRREEFARQLDVLAELCTVVSLSEIFQPQTLLGPRPRVAITLDDAYRGAVRLGLPELRSRGLPATVFVAPGILGGRSMWWDSLDVQPWTTDRVCLDELHGDDERIRAWGVAQGREVYEMDEYGRTSGVEELKAVAPEGVTFAAHGWQHLNMAALPHSVLEEELRRPLAWLREHFPAAHAPWLAYPYGLTTASVCRAALAAGYEHGVIITGGFIPSKGGVDPFLVPRLNVPAGLSEDGFRLRLSGVFCR